jgi:hypothetical protein
MTNLVFIGFSKDESYRPIRIKWFEVKDIEPNELRGIVLLENPNPVYLSGLYGTTELYLNIGGETSLINTNTQKIDMNYYEEKEITFTHPLPNGGIPKGDYTIYYIIYERTGSSLAVSLVDLDQIGVETDFLLSLGQFIDYRGEERFSLSGPLFQSGEKPIFKAILKNFGKKELDVKARIKVFKRDEYYENQPAAEIVYGNYVFLPEETREISIELPEFSEPESYLAVIHMMDSNLNIVSDTLKARYVVWGEVGKIISPEIDTSTGKMVFKASLIGPPIFGSLEGARFRIEVFDRKDSFLLAKEEIEADIGQDFTEIDIVLLEYAETKNVQVVGTLEYNNQVLDRFVHDYTISPNHLVDIFSDISRSPYRKEIIELFNMGIIKGYPDNTFRPSNPLTRAEFSAIVRLITDFEEEIDSVTSENYFADVDSDHWASDTIQFVRRVGLIAGYPDGTFKPDNNISHGECLSILVRLLNQEEEESELPWPENHIKIAGDLGILYDIEIDNHRDFATREDIVKYVWNVLKTIEKV